MKYLKLRFVKVEQSKSRIQNGLPDRVHTLRSVHGIATTSGSSRQQPGRTQPRQSAHRPTSCWRDCCGRRNSGRDVYIFYHSDGDDSCCSCCQCDQITECCCGFLQNIACNIEPEVSCNYACSLLGCILDSLLRNDDWKRAPTENQLGWAWTRFSKVRILFIKNFSHNLVRILLKALHSSPVCRCTPTNSTLY